MTEQEYRQHPALSRSTLWKLQELGTPEKFKYWLEHPEAPTSALVFGQAAHKMLLQPETFWDDFAVAPLVDRRTKDGKAEYAKFLEDKGDRQELASADFSTIAAMWAKAKETPFISRLLEGEREKPLFWADEETGLQLKARLDVLTEIGGEPVIVDYKTAQDASLDGFTRHALKYGYDFQAGMYSEAVEIATGKTPRFVFVVQEKEAPYSVNIVEADSLFIQRGKDKFRELIGIYHECCQTGNWYGYMGPEPVIAELSLPAWAAEK